LHVILRHEVPQLDPEDASLLPTASPEQEPGGAAKTLRRVEITEREITTVIVRRKAGKDETDLTSDEHGDTNHPSKTAG